MRKRFSHRVGNGAVREAVFLLPRGDWQGCLIHRGGRVVEYGDCAGRFCGKRENISS
jgi:hypothetical protein